MLDFTFERQLELEEDVSVIKPLFELAKTFSPDYDEEQVFKAWENRK